MDKPKRIPTRLKEYDYSQNGVYFVTICTEKRKPILSHIAVGQGLAPAEIVLSPIGTIAKEHIAALETRYSCVKIEKYAIMPNHIHILLSICKDTAGASPCPTLSDIICSFKSLITR